MRIFFNNLAGSFIGGMCSLIALLLLVKFGPENITNLFMPETKLMEIETGEEDTSAIVSMAILLEKSGAVDPAAIVKDKYETGEELFLAYCSYLKTHGVISECLVDGQE